MTGKEQLRILAFVLLKFLLEMEEHPRQRHFKASASSPLSKPSFSITRRCNTSLAARSGDYATARGKIA